LQFPPRADYRADVTATRSEPVTDPQGDVGSFGQPVDPPSEPPASPPGDQPQAEGPGPLPAPPGQPPPDPNIVAIERAGLAPDMAGWLRQVAGQVDARLDRISSSWRSSPQADAARACAFGLLLGQLATLYPHAGDPLHRTAEAHPSFSTLPAGGRLQTLRQIAADPERMGAWLGPLIGMAERDRVRALLD
jgi:hypothetical protein